MRTLKDISDVRTFCCNNNLFTKGSARQYNLLFDMLENYAPLHDVALIIWVCSETEWSVEYLEGKLREILGKDC